MRRLTVRIMRTMMGDDDYGYDEALTTDASDDDEA